MLTRLLLFFLWSNLFLFFVKHAHCCCFDTTMPAVEKKTYRKVVKQIVDCIVHCVIVYSFFCCIFFYCIGVWNDYDWCLMLGLSSLIGAAIHLLYPLSFYTMHEWESYNRNNIAVVSDIVRSEFFSGLCVYNVVIFEEKKRKNETFMYSRKDS